MNAALLQSLADYPEDLAALSAPPTVCFVEEIALGGRDGDRADSLLQHAKKIGTEMLTELTAKAVRRLIKSGEIWYYMAPGMLTGGLFNEAELDELEENFAALAATAELLGRSRIRLRQQHAERYSEDEPTDFSIFAETNLSPMAPLEALAYFRKLVPTLGVESPHFGSLMERHGFTMAKATSETMLRKVKSILEKQLEEGIDPRRAIRQIDAILDEAGVTKRNPGYAEMVVRTNFGEAFNAGSQREFSDPDIADDFPAWKYLGVDDGRERHGPLPKYPDHKRWFNRYFDRRVLFADVRGRDIRDVAQCRCNQSPVYVRRWERLQEQGARIEPWPI